MRPVDDSVARVDAGQLQLLRRARGFCAVPIALDRPVPRILAVGGHLKNTVALSLGRDVVLSPHVGDLDNTLSMAVHRRAVQDLVEFFEVTPEIVACDLHPDYGSTRHAEQLADQWQVPLVPCAAPSCPCAVGHGRMAIDRAGAGTVLGRDRLRDATARRGVARPSWSTVRAGRVWLICVRFRCPAAIASRASRAGRRSGCCTSCSAAACPEAARWFSEAEWSTLRSALERGHAFPRTSSMGRLFDAVAALSGLKDRVSFEGEAAMQLEFAVDPAEAASYDCRSVTRCRP